MKIRIYSISPYAYCANNPINAIDLNGDSIWYTVDKDVVTMHVTGKIIDSSSDGINVNRAASDIASGISEVFSGKKNLAKGIKVEVSENIAKIDVNIIVEYGSRIPDVAFEIQNRVKKAVESMTGLKVEEVNVHVQGVNTDTAKNDTPNESEDNIEE